MEAIIFVASVALSYKLWRGVQEGGPRTKAVEVREIAERPLEPVAAQLPDASSTTTPAAQAEAVDSIMRAAVMPRAWTDANSRDVYGVDRGNAPSVAISYGNAEGWIADGKVYKDWATWRAQTPMNLPTEAQTRANQARALADQARFNESMKNIKVLTWDDAVKLPPTPPTPPKKPMTAYERGIAAYEVQEKHRRARLLSQ
jgi:hypothetical protein